jgi:hypothetical protein
MAADSGAGWNMAGSGHLSVTAEAAAKKISSNPAYGLYHAHMSPDCRWIVFNAEMNSPNRESSLFVIPAPGVPWTRFTDGKHWDDKPRWSLMEKRSTSYPAPAAFSMSGGFTSIRLRANQSGSRFRCPNLTAHA